jgi:hypothetical protein
MTGRLAPSGQQFLPELLMLGEIAIAAAEVIRDRLASPVGRREHADALDAHAQKADRLAAGVAIDAPRALVPPIDAEDAARLARYLRDAVAATRRVGFAADLARPTLPDPRATPLAELLVQAADSLEGAAASLTDRFRALDFAGDVRLLNHEGERAYVEAMGALLAAAPGGLGAVRQAELYRALRESLRACGRASALVESIAFKRF